MRSTPSVLSMAAALLLGVVFCPPTAAQRMESAEGPAPLAARDLARGTVIEESDFYFEAPADSATGPIGWMTRRVVAKGEPLQSPTIAPAEIVRSGDTVQLVWSDGTMELRVAGKAMNSAALGESVNVRVDVHRRFSGTALGVGVVRLDTPESDRLR